MVTITSVAAVVDATALLTSKVNAAPTPFKLKSVLTLLRTVPVMLPTAAAVPGPPEIPEPALRIVFPVTVNVAGP